MLRGTCERRRLLDLVEYFTLFSEHKALLILNWRQKSAARSVLKLAVEGALDGLPQGYDRLPCAQKCSALFEHVYESYPERDAGVHAGAA